MNKQLITIIFSLSICGLTQADTQIKEIDQSGESNTITCNESMCRMDNSNDPGYTLFDASRQQFKMVDTQRRKVMVMDLKSAKKQAPPATNKVKVSLKKIGKGPKIAGYSTYKYTLSANGKLCNTIYASKAAMNIKGIANLFDAMNTMNQNSLNVMGGFRSMMDECEEANMQSEKLFKSSGAPLRTMDANDQLESEIQSINKNAKIDKAFYQAPADYQQVSMQQQMDQARQQMDQARQQMKQNMPAMNQIMQQMQQDGGNLSPEAMQQMKKMQEMMKQYQQQ